MNRKSWHAAVHGVAKSQTWLSHWTEQAIELQSTVGFQNLKNEIFLWAITFKMSDLNSVFKRRDLKAMTDAWSSWQGSRTRHLLPQQLSSLRRVMLWANFPRLYNQSHFPGGSDSKESAYNVGAVGNAVSIPGSGRSPGEGHANPLQNSCLGNPTGRLEVHGVTKTLTQLSN